MDSLLELQHGSAVHGHSGAAGLVLLDCRFDLQDPAAGRRAFLEAHIPGAKYADLNRDLSRPVTADTGRHPLPSPEALADFCTAAGIGAHTQVVAYDGANGSFAARAWWLLHWLGHTHAAVLDGGFKAWTAAGGPVESGAVESGAVETGVVPAAVTPDAPDVPDAPVPMVARFTPRPQHAAVLGAADVAAALNDPRRLLIDARAPERFDGRVEPLDAVAGHVPGAVNHPFAGNLADDGHFLPAPELKRRWLLRLEGRRPADVIQMCGSGVTACHNLLAMAAAGLPGARLYAGSWSEWIRDPLRPVAAAGRDGAR